MPSWPCVLAPQQRTAPVNVVAQVCSPPAEMPVTPPPRPATVRGAWRPNCRPSPSWPLVFAPQHIAAPSATTHECESPSESAATPLASPGTSVGVSMRVSGSPMPSCPDSLRPQHLRPLVAVIAQVWKAPAASPSNPLPAAVTATGEMRSSTVPSPTCPSWLLPQQRASPVWVRAQVCWAPVARPATPLPRPATGTGANRRTCVPSPNCPWPLSPQHHTAPPCTRAQLCSPPVATAYTGLGNPDTAT